MCAAVVRCVDAGVAPGGDLLWWEHDRTNAVLFVDADALWKTDVAVWVQYRRSTWKAIDPVTRDVRRAMEK